MTTFIVLKQARKLGRSPLLELILRDQSVLLLQKYRTFFLNQELTFSPCPTVFHHKKTALLPVQFRDLPDIVRPHDGRK